MANKKVTRRALAMSIVSLILCCAMLVGTTFAWFTDSESSAVNTIQSGTLDVDLVNEAGNSVVGETLKFVKAEGAPADEAVLWEPNCTYELEPVKVVNNGNLALKYQVSITGINGSNKLLEVIDFEISDTFEGHLLSKEKSGVITITAHMDKDAGNEYQGLTLDGVGITVVATQYDYEFDSFGKDYDESAELPVVISGDEYPIVNVDTDVKIGSAVIPAGALINPNEKPVFSADPIDVPDGVPVEQGHAVQTFDINATNINFDKKLPIKMELKIPAGLDPNFVKTYHYAENIPNSYNPYDGSVTFSTTSFSPFTVTFDENAKYEPPVADENDLPKATVVRSSEYENTELPWGQWGDWSPSEGLEANLEAAYTFSCLQSLDEAKASPYANWYCDFYVMLDRELGENQIFLGGNYGDFGWVGFHNRDLTLDANTEIPLLDSVGAPWTYLEIVQNVGNFICGVGDVDDALSGATFTVMLRLTNPENEAEFYNVETVTYTFN